MQPPNQSYVDLLGSLQSDICFLFSCSAFTYFLAKSVQAISDNYPHNNNYIEKLDRIVHDLNILTYKKMKEPRKITKPCCLDVQIKFCQAVESNS